MAELPGRNRQTFPHAFFQAWANFSLCELFHGELSPIQTPPPPVCVFSPKWAKMAENCTLTVLGALSAELSRNVIWGHGCCGPTGPLGRAQAPIRSETLSFWGSNFSSFDSILKATGHGSQVVGHVKTLKFKQLSPYPKPDTEQATKNGAEMSLLANTHRARFGSLEARLGAILADFGCWSPLFEVFQENRLGYFQVRLAQNAPSAPPKTCILTVLGALSVKICSDVVCAYGR